MKARIEPFQDGLGEVRYRVIAETAVWAAAQRAQSEVEAINEAGFKPAVYWWGPVQTVSQPFGGKGEPFDPPEDPSRTVPVTYTKWPVSDDYASGAVPPNCDFVSHAHSGQEPTQAGQVLAQAQHEAAEDGEGCGSVACAMTRGVND